MGIEQVTAQFPQDEFESDLGLDHLESIVKSPFIKIQTFEDSLDDLHRTIFTGKKALAIFGGPPGSGKSTFINILRTDYRFDIQFLLHTYEEHEKMALEESGLKISREEIVPPEIRARANVLLEQSIDKALDKSLEYPRSSVVVVEAPNLGYPDWEEWDWGATAVLNTLKNQREGIETHLAYLFPTNQMVRAAEERDARAQQYLQENRHQYNETEKSYGGAGSNLVKMFLQEFSSRSLKEAFQHPEIRDQISFAHMNESAKNLLREDVDYPLHWKNIYVALRNLPLTQPIHLSGYIVDYGSRSNRIHPAI